MNNKTELTKQFKEKLINKTLKVGLIGAGYVGSSTGKAAAKQGFLTIAFDLSSQVVERINGEKNPNFTATNNIEDLKECDLFLVAVPTPVGENHQPDLEPIKGAAETLTKILRPGQLITLESTVSPGTTRETLLPILQKTGLTAENDLFIGYSPHRVDFASKEWTVENIPKVVGGYDKESLELLRSFYATFVEKVVPVSSLETAEMVKILENTFRFVNINFINDLMDYCKARHMDLNEVVSAASTKPFGFLAHYPGAGISGHCIPVDPYYLYEDAKKMHTDIPILKSCFDYHEGRMDKIAAKANAVLKEKKGKKILIVGVAIKPGLSDTRESVAEKLWEKCEKQGAELLYHDPIVPNFNGQSSLELSEDTLKRVDLILMITYHPEIDYSLLYKSGKPIIDTNGTIHTDETEVIAI